MTDRPDLDRLWTDVPVGQPALDTVLRGGTRLRRTRQAFGGLAVVVVVALIGGAASLASEPRADRPPDVTATPDADATPEGPTTATLFYLLDEPGTGDSVYEEATLITPRTVQIDSTGRPGFDALHALLTSPPPGSGLSVGFNFIGDDATTDVESVTHEGGVVDVELSGTPWDPYPTYDICCVPDGSTVTQQLVHTVQTALGTTDPVAFNGRGIWFDKLDGPVEADPDRVVPSTRQVTMAAAEVGARADAGVDVTGPLGLRDGCATLAGRAVLMPRGWTAWEVGGTAVLLDEDGLLVARAGDPVEMNGSYIDGPGPAPCVAAGDGLWVKDVHQARD